MRGAFRFALMKASSIIDLEKFLPRTHGSPSSDTRLLSILHGVKLMDQRAGALKLYDVTSFCDARLFLFMVLVVFYSYYSMLASGFHTRLVLCNFCQLLRI